jgi:phosphatidylcholine synthase
LVGNVQSDSRLGVSLRGAWPAALVHLITALGAVCALLAMIAVWEGAWEFCFAWLGLALIIDGVDGTLARMARVGERLPRFSGERLDLVVDYMTYVVVPTLALLKAGYLKAQPGVALASLILVSSLYHFSDTESKTKDHSFVGFPATWNIVAFYIFAFALPPWIAGLVVLSFVLLTFVPLAWAHPLRTMLLWPVTVTMMVLWGAASLLIIYTGFPATPALKAVLLVVGLYAAVLTLARNQRRN